MSGDKQFQPARKRGATFSVRRGSIHSRLRVGLPVLLLAVILLFSYGGNPWVDQVSFTTQAWAQTAGTFAPFIDIVPSQDGAALYITAGGVGQLSGITSVNLDVGPGHLKRSYTMVYSETLESYITTASDFFPEVYAEAPLNFTTSGGESTGSVTLNRHYLRTAATPSLNAVDGGLQLTVVHTATFNTPVYITLVPSFAAPAALPSGNQLVSTVYNVRASGDIGAAQQPMVVRMNYIEANLNGASPSTLAIWLWNAQNQRWEDLGGSAFSSRDRYVSVASPRFGTYALVATTTWRDDFNTFSGVDFSRFQNVNIGGTLEERTLVLDKTPGTGIAVSQPITPTTGFTHWGVLTFYKGSETAATRLTIDLLDAQGALVLAGVASGTDLSTRIAAQAHPSLRLRANFTSTVSGESPMLEAWQLSWQMPASGSADENKLYLPLLRKQ